MGVCTDRSRLRGKCASHIILDDASFVGEIPVRQDITVLPADVPRFISVDVVKEPEEAARFDICPDGCLKVWDDEIISKGKGGRKKPKPEQVKVPVRLGFVIHEQIGIAIVNPAIKSSTVEIVEQCPDGCLEVWDDEWISKA